MEDLPRFLLSPRTKESSNCLSRETRVFRLKRIASWVMSRTKERRVSKLPWTVDRYLNNVVKSATHKTSHVNIETLHPCALCTVLTMYLILELIKKKLKETLQPLNINPHLFWKSVQTIAAKGSTPSSSPLSISLIFFFPSSIRSSQKKQKKNSPIQTTQPRQLQVHMVYNLLMGHVWRAISLKTCTVSHSSRDVQWTTEGMCSEQLEACMFNNRRHVEWATSQDTQWITRATCYERQRGMSSELDLKVCSEPPLGAVFMMSHLSGQHSWWATSWSSPHG